MTLDPLELAGLRLAIGEQAPELLPNIATDALVRGLDSPALREAAGVSPRDVDDARDLFEKALRELGLGPPAGEQEALWCLIRYTAQQIVDGGTSPSAGAAWIASVWRRATPEGDLRIFVGLMSELEDHPDSWPAIDGGIVREAEELLRRPRPRTWVQLRAQHQRWPLWRPSPPDAFEPSEGQLSDRLRADLREWSRRVEEAGPPTEWGVSQFSGPREAEAFVTQGRSLVDRLQQELGPEYHVEYWPEPTHPYGGFRPASVAQRSRRRWRRDER